MRTMRRAVRTLTTLTCLAVAVLAAPPAEARRVGFSAPEPSVFPQPRDPWRSWGVRSELPKRVGLPHVVTKPDPRGVWVPGHWAWDGAAWVWWPGHWGVPVR